MNVPNTRTDTEKWLEGFGTQFVEVFFWVPVQRAAGRRSGMIWVEERHVADETTIDETILMSLDRLRAPAAVYERAGRWVLRERSGRVRDFEKRAQAEMLAMHSG